jgi:hypothetical protein
MGRSPNEALCTLAGVLSTMAPAGKAQKCCAGPSGAQVFSHAVNSLVNLWQGALSQSRTACPQHHHCPRVSAHCTGMQLLFGFLVVV